MASRGPVGRPETEGNSRGARPGRGRGDRPEGPLCGAPEGRWTVWGRLLPLPSLERLAAFPAVRRLSLWARGVAPRWGCGRAYVSVESRSPLSRLCAALKSSTCGVGRPALPSNSDVPESRGNAELD